MSDKTQLDPDILRALALESSNAVHVLVGQALAHLEGSGRGATRSFAGADLRHMDPMRIFGVKVCQVLRSFTWSEGIIDKANKALDGQQFTAHRAVGYEEQSKHMQLAADFLKYLCLNGISDVGIKVPVEVTEMEKSRIMDALGGAHEKVRARFLSSVSVLEASY